ncbi:hypothetical protein CMI37_34270 [Candidatus Pacearchaeota archaeon]|nr:hypothetical protein [Candidatus Pacearchaeota archaeon]|tara:strand:+ start:2396 stop:2683 length:288 start_codon:yes stop_codon:yes gene_type:complete
MMSADRKFDDFEGMSKEELLDYQEQVADDMVTLLSQWMDTHNRTCTEDSCCEPLNLLAYFAHSLGVRRTIGTGAEFEEHLQSYENKCPDCSHLRN